MTELNCDGCARSGDKIRQLATEVEAYRAAVADLRAILARESERWSHKLRDMHVVLDRLSREEGRLPRGAT